MKRIIPFILLILLPSVGSSQLEVSQAEMQRLMSRSRVAPLEGRNVFHCMGQSFDMRKGKEANDSVKRELSSRLMFALRNEGITVAQEPTSPRSSDEHVTVLLSIITTPEDYGVRSGVTLVVQGSMINPITNKKAVMPLWRDQREYFLQADQEVSKSEITHMIDMLIKDILRVAE